MSGVRKTRQIRQPYKDDRQLLPACSFPRESCRTRYWTCSASEVEGRRRRSVDLPDKGCCTTRIVELGNAVDMTAVQTPYEVVENCTVQCHQTEFYTHPTDNKFLEIKKITFTYLRVGCKYCDEYVCLSVCLSLSPLAYLEDYTAKRHQFSTHVACGRGSSFWWLCDTSTYFQFSG